MTAEFDNPQQQQCAWPQVRTIGLAGAQLPTRLFCPQIVAP
ncbi:hypothetical protein [Streptomyces colonosanans]|nr:hypothetical protein [Streptomyces colonosanans]